MKDDYQIGDTAGVRVKTYVLTSEGMAETQIDEAPFLNGIGALFRALSIMHSPYDFRSGHLDYNVLEDLPEEELASLSRIREKILNNESPQNRPSMEDSIAKMLQSETGLVIKDPSRIKPIYSSARHAIDQTLRKVAGGKKVALPVPNWNFWDKLDGCKEGAYGFEYIEALNENQLVDNFRRVSSQKDIASLLLVNPSNPLGFSISERAAKDLNSIAEKNGQTVVVDDLLRGNRPIGDRHTIGEHFSRAYLVEGFSHRFGEGELGNLSYVLVPEGDCLFGAGEIEDSLFPEGISAALKYSTKPIFDMLTERNGAFDRGVSEFVPEIKIFRPHSGSITSVVELPNYVKANALDFYQEAAANGVHIQPLCAFLPRGMPVPKYIDKMFRVAVGAMDESSVYQGAKRLGMGIKSNKQK